MAGATIDHLVSLTVLLAALLLFISFFNQVIQTAILYQQHRYLATRCSDLLDNTLLSPGIPSDWAKSNVSLIGFGLQDPDFTQYRLNPISLIRLQSLTGQPVHYPNTGLTYNNLSIGFGNSILVPYTEVVNRSTVARLLGINNTCGFQLTIAPTVNVTITEAQPNPLRVIVKASGPGFPFANANVNYCLITANTTGSSATYPSYNVGYGTNATDSQGSTFIDFPGFDGTQRSYVLVVHTYLSGLVGVGYYEHASYNGSYVVPFISSFGSDRSEIIVAHSNSVYAWTDPAELVFNATFVLTTDDFELARVQLENSTGSIGGGTPYRKMAIPTYDSGILIITFKKNSTQEGGIVLMPWGLNPLASAVTFGYDPSGNEWVAADIRQVLIYNVAYQAKLCLWSLEGYQVVR